MKKRKSAQKKKSIASKFDVMRRELKGKMFKGYATLSRRKALKRGRDIKRERENTMARKRRGRRTKRAFSFAKRSGKSILGFRVPPMIQKAGTGIGMAVIAGAVIDKLVPQAQPYKDIVKLGAAYFGGGIEGVVGQVIVGGGLPGILTGVSTASTGADPNMIG